MPSKPCLLRINEVHRQKLGCFDISQPSHPWNALPKITARPSAPKLTEAGRSLLLLVVPVVPTRRHNTPVHEGEGKHHARTWLPRPAQMHVGLADARARDHTSQEDVAGGLVGAPACVGRDEPLGFAVDVAVLHQHLGIAEDEVHTALDVAVAEVLPPIVQICGVLPTQEAALIERAPVCCNPNCDRLARALRGRILKGDILGDEILPLHDHRATCECPCADHLRRLVMLDACGRVRPCQDGFVRILALHFTSSLP